ncbi:MAG: GatB/YqeY domain-containing protein [Anaerolineae bacterium]|nr:GatB/YqeY domain-containing protein [Candidatus Roseilinea sp.]MDW8450939.1 GatB/YqeY domain-containing protein [Anaerolineae bacterium]
MAGLAATLVAGHFALSGLSRYSLYNMQAGLRKPLRLKQDAVLDRVRLKRRMEAVLKQRIQDELKAAMRGGDEARKTVLRLLVAHIKNAEVEARTDGRGGVLSDSDVLALVRREIKQHEESLLEAQNAGREDLVAQQQAELDVLKEFLPKQLSREEIVELAKQTIKELNATSPKQHGQVMKALQPKVKDIADGKLVNEVVRELLG